MTFGIMALSIMGVIVTLNLNDTKHKDLQQYGTQLLFVTLSKMGLIVTLN
jgi:hypothetical protein